jgi:hypothetical protein
MPGRSGISAFVKEEGAELSKWLREPVRAPALFSSRGSTFPTICSAVCQRWVTNERGGDKGRNRVFCRALRGDGYAQVMVERQDSTVACTYELFRSAAFRIHREGVHQSVKDSSEVEDNA